METFTVGNPLCQDPGRLIPRCGGRIAVTVIRCDKLWAVNIYRIGGKCEHESGSP